MKRLLALFMAAIGLSVAALAVTTIDLSNLDGLAAPGDLSDPDHYLDNNVLVLPDGVVLTGTLPSGSYCKVSIETNATVVLSNVNIDQATLRCGCAGISCRGSATIVLEGANTVIGDYGYPGIFVPVSDPANTKIVPGSGLQTPKQGDATLTIKTRELCCGLTTPGTLKAKGNDFGAGIGCGNVPDDWDVDTTACGHIVIESGIITAWGGSSISGGGGAGIGSVGSGYHGDIIIKGGTVEAEGGCDAPGIGGGCLPDEVTGEVTGYKGRIIILGGEVEAIGGGEHGPGIGSGIGCALGDILISGGSVTAEGGLWVPGIGVPSSVPDATCGNITIAPGVASVVVVTGYDAEERDDIIGSRDDDISTVCGQITLPEPADGYDITTDYVTDTCTIRPSAWDGNLTGLTRNVVATDGMTITGTLSGDRKVSIVDGATVTLDGVRINGSSSASSPHAGITCLGDANIILEGNNYVRPFGTGPAAIAYYKRTVNMGNNQYLPASYSFAYVLDISGDGTLNVGGTLPGPQPMGARLLDANISYGGAGLGAGVDEDCGDLVINGGTISATGGNGAAGIGGAHGASSGSIEILGGTVNATGGDGAAGIGSGDDSGCGDITISGATVTATAGANATPIGAGAGGGPVNVTLDGVSDTTSGSTRIIVPYEDLGALTDDLLLTDGMTICGTLAGNYKVSIADGATVTLSDVTINGVNSSSCLWAGITCEGDATIILSGANTVKGFYSNYPGIHVPTNHTLTIKGSGSLDASSNGDGAGIGGGSAIPCGNIVIRGGTITAQGGTWAAGIGGGHNSGTSSNNKSRCGTISILGGHVTATGGSNAAGIGTGRNSCCGDIVIAPGVTVIATKGSNGNPISTGSAIGHGMLTVPTAADGMSDTTVDWTRTIRPLEWDGNLATLTRNAIATDGMTIYNTLGGVYKVSIAAGATVTLSNAVVNLDRDSVTNNVDYSWAGINCLGDANIILAGTSTVSGFYKNYPGIHVPAGSALTIDGSGTLNAIGTDCGGAGIGGGWEVNCGNIVIAGGKIVATGADSVPGIGVGSSATGGVITISGGNVTATGGMGAAGIGSGLGGSTCGDITITGGIVDASGGPRAAGIGRGASAMYQDGQWYNSTCGDISIGPGIVCVSATGSEGNPIRGNGAVTVDSSLLDDHGYPTRVITAPGAWDGNLATLTHNAIATDGMTIYNTLGGIYKVSIADGATVTLSNAVINLDRDSVTNNPSCRWAGVNCVGDATLQLKGMSTVSGFYLEYPGIHVPEDSTLTINGSGALNAIGTDCGGAGIGGGCYVDCGNIVIAGGNIVATGANSVPGIGVGSFSTGGDITITGGNVTATAGIGAAGIGSGMGDSTCGDITITGGTVDARGGPRAPGIGSGVSARYEDGEFYYSACGDIYIGSGIVCVSATSGGGNPIRGNGAVTVDSGLVDRTSADGMTRTITAAGNTAFLPGDRTTNAYSTQGEAETAAASIQIVAPADVQAGLSSGDLANYLGCFTKKVVQNPAGEGYVVVVALTEQAEETLQEQADDDVADEILPAITGSEVTVTTTPGFYYSVKWGDEPDCSDQTIPVLATGTSLALELPKGENPAATFYKLVIDFTR